MNKKIICIAFCLATAVTVYAQQERNKSLTRSLLRGWEFEIKAGFKIGGSAPIPLPEEIREIKGYNPTLSIPLEGRSTKWFGLQRVWGLTTGLKMEEKSMETRARVKNYSTRIIGDGGEQVSGNWTGHVKTKVNLTYLTLPVLAAYRLDNRWIFRTGVYASLLTDGNFSGHVYEGYLREGNPTGPKVEFEGDKIATYDFSGDLRRFAWGAQLGASWRAFKHFNVYADLSWGLNDIFKKDFKTITFAMYPVYADFGFGYVF
jgi:hypothetical protein